MISGRTEIIAHLGYPTESFTAPMIYNPWFAHHGIDAVVVPMGVRAEHYAAFLRPLFSLSNIRGALVTMPHKVTTVGLLDDVSVAVEIAGSCNAILRRPDGSLYGDMFDGVGFTRAARGKGFDFAGADCLVVGAGGVGSAIAAAIAAEGGGSGPGSIALYESVRRRRRGSPRVCAGTTPASMSGSATTIPPDTASSSTRRRSGWPRAIRCRSTRSASRPAPWSAMSCWGRR